MDLLVCVAGVFQKEDELAMHSQDGRWLRMMGSRCVCVWNGHAKMACHQEAVTHRTTQCSRQRGSAWELGHGLRKEG